MASKQVLSELNMDNNNAGSDSGGIMRLSPDSRGRSLFILRSGGRTLPYRPLDGPTPHPLIDPVREDIMNFSS
jgi:hypothetical protein